MRFQKGNRAAKGGARPGAGRKPSAKTLLARLALDKLDEEAERSIRFLVVMRNDKKVCHGVRLEAARELIHMRFGKPKQAHDVKVESGEDLAAQLKAARQNDE